MGLTQAQIAEPHLTSAYVSLIEAGRREPSLNALRHISRRLRMDLGELWDGRSSDIEVRLELSLQEARQAVDDGDLQGARDTVVDVAREAQSHGLVRVQAGSEEVLGAIAERNSGPQEGLEHYQRAEHLWRDQPVHLRAETVAGIARCTHQLGDAPLALYLLESYKRELTDSGTPDPNALMRTNTALIYPYFTAGVPEKAAEAARDALRLESQVEDPEQIACMHLTVARSLLHSGHYEEALRSIRRAETIYARDDRRNQLAKTHIAEGIALAKKEEFATARDMLIAALELLAESPNRLDEALALNELGFVTRHLGDVDSAIGYLERAEPLLKDADVIEKGFNQREIGLCLVNRDLERAERHLKLAIDWYRVSGTTTELATTFKALGELYARQGKNDQAMEAFKEGLAAVEERSA